MATGEFLGFLNLSWQAVAMLVIGGVLMWLGIAKKSGTSSTCAYWVWMYVS